MSAIDVKQHEWTNKREYPPSLHSNPKFVSISSSPIGQLQFPASSKWPNSPENVFDKEELAQKIAEAKTEKDLFWINHERTQMNIQREECKKLMSKMQKEMERLHMANRELERRLYVERTGTEEIEELEKELSAERQINADLRRELGLAVKRSAKLAQMLEKSTNTHKEQMAENRIIDYENYDYEEVIYDFESDKENINPTSTKRRRLGYHEIKRFTDENA